MRNGLRLAVGLLFLLPAASVARAEPPAERFESLRCRLERSVPTFALFDPLPIDRPRAPEALVAQVGGGDRPPPVARRLKFPDDPRASNGMLRGWVLMPSGPANRPTVLDIRAGRPRRADAGAEPVIVRSTLPLVERFVFNDDLVFGGVAGAKPEVYDQDVPYFFLAKIVPQGAASIATRLPTEGLAEDARVTIKISLAPTHEGLVQLAATWGAKTFAPVAAVRGKPLSTVSYACDGRDVPKDGAPLVLRDATTSMPPTTPEDASDDRGAIWIDAVEIRAPVAATKDVLRIEIEPDLVQRLEVVDLSKVATRHVDAPDPVAAAKGAAEVILTTAATAAGAARLAAHRTAQGVRCVAIPFADLVDRLGYGTYDPTLVGRFLSAIEYVSPPPRFLLLAGDANRDQGDDPATSIPTGYGRTMYNGATASDRLLVRTGLEEGIEPPSVGRLPFRDAATMDAYVDRLIAYETKPPADASRRLLRFVTSEGRFGPVIDGLLERLFTNVVTYAIPPSYDVEVTFANANSAYGWPPARFNQKVVDGLNEGALFYTYVGHGWAEGFDWLRVGASRFPILRSADVPGVDVRGTPPAMFVVACTTATFDDPAETGIGERLLSRPRGPLAYWGATRVCHPAWNALIGRQIALEIFKDPGRRLGEVLDAAEREIVEPTPLPPGESPMKDPGRRDRMLIETAARSLTPGSVPFERILEEGTWMYALLGDPALRVALPKDDLSVKLVEAAAAGGGDVGVDREVKVRVEAAPGGPPLEDGSIVEVSLEVPRDQIIGRPLEKGLSADDGMRARHASSNDKALVRVKALVEGGAAEATLVVPGAWSLRTLWAKAWTITNGDVAQGFVSVRRP